MQKLVLSHLGSDHGNVPRARPLHLKVLHLKVSPFEGMPNFQPREAWPFGRASIERLRANRIRSGITLRDIVSTR